jgi:gas vesicle protein
LQQRDSERICYGGLQTSSVSAFLLGIAVGSAAALLFAPVSGRRLRTLMGERVDEGRQAVKAHVKQGWDKATEVVKEAGTRVDSAAKHLVKEVAL